ncbi:hypothetical protein AC1031_019940 [Aphanomyces cochlioides]|nr:hypothetical protein AC1031_019940 [Aphanomyces cochlioides]
MAKKGDGRSNGDQPREIFMYEGMKINRCEICKNPKRHKAWCLDRWEQMLGKTTEATPVVESSPAEVAYGAMDAATDTAPAEAPEAETTAHVVASIISDATPDVEIVGVSKPEPQPPKKREGKASQGGGAPVRVRNIRPCPYCPCKTRKHLHKDTKNCLFYAYYKKRLADEAADPHRHTIIRRSGENHFDACAREYEYLNRSTRESSTDSFIAPPKTIDMTSSTPRDDAEVPEDVITEVPPTVPSPNSDVADRATTNEVPQLSSSSPSSPTIKSTDPATPQSPGKPPADIALAPKQVEESSPTSLVPVKPDQPTKKSSSTKSSSSKATSSSSSSAKPSATNATVAGTPTATTVPYAVAPGMPPLMWYMYGGQQMMSSMPARPPSGPSSSATPSDPTAKPTELAAPEEPTTTHRKRKRAAAAAEDAQIKRHRLLENLLAMIERDQAHAKQHDEELVKLQLERLEFDRQLQRERIAFDRAQAEKAQKRFESNQAIIKQLLAELGATAPSRSVPLPLPSVPPPSTLPTTSATGHASST